MRGVRLSITEVNERFRSIGLTLRSPYTNAHQEVTVRCQRCGNTYTTQPYNVLQGRGCARCNKYKPPQISQAEVTKRLRRIGVEPRENYRGHAYRIKVQCSTCHHTWRVFPTSLFQGHGCPRCANYGVEQLTQAEVGLRLKRRSITLRSRYAGYTKPIRVQCHTCHHRWQAAAQTLLNGSGCPKCRPRIGGKTEAEVRRIVERVTGWRFVRVRPSWLRGWGARAMELDGYNARHKVAFEYQGEQHYLPMHGAKVLQRIKRNDRRKRDLCRYHGVLLIRIPYWKADVAAFVRTKLAQRRPSI